MKITSASLYSAGLLFGSVCVHADTVVVPQKAPYTNDANTVLLEHFDNSTTGTPYGDVTYTNGFFGQAAHLIDSSYIGFPPPSPGADGQTIEFWGKLDALPAGTAYWSFIEG